LEFVQSLPVGREFVIWDFEQIVLGNNGLKNEAED
jgi:hypothetical protein